jgi:hypothetical protein
MIRQLAAVLLFYSTGVAQQHGNTLQSENSPPLRKIFDEASHHATFELPKACRWALIRRVPLQSHS